MSSDDSKLNADSGSRHGSGSGSDIKLPPISFLSGHGRPHNKLPSASNMGISSYLSHHSGSYSSQSPDSNDEHSNKKPKLEDTNAELDSQTSSQKSALLGLYNAANLSPNAQVTPNNETKVHDRSSEQHSRPLSSSFNHSHNNPAHNTPSSIPPHTHSNPHHHHHHHHHHHVHRDSPGESSPNGIPHIHDGNHVHVLARGEGDTLGTEKRDTKQDLANRIYSSHSDEVKKEENVVEKSELNPAKTSDNEQVPNLEKNRPEQRGEDQINDSQVANDITEISESAVEVAPKSTQRIKSQRVRIDKSQLLEILKELFPHRHNLGTLVYNPTTTWSTLQTAQLTGLKPEHHERFQQLKENYEDKLKEEYFRNNYKYIPMIPPLSNDYINYLLEIKIPYKFIKLFKEDLDEGNIPIKRQIWGGASGIYTDDSDILLVLTHLGLFNGNMDLTEWNEKWTSDDIITPLDTRKDPNEIHGDLSVTILLLPSLPDYHGYYANGINSKPWIRYNKHNGLSYAVYDVKWESYGSYLRDKTLFKRYQTELYDDMETTKEELSAKKGWSFNFAYYKQLKHKFETLDKQNPEKSIKDSKTDNS
mmetsp:Transcript_1867/g.2025  ORF Transcript_1867/g.2025 Transcript_1867/m.2025 type:complete len:589 (-) Transcript_1867:4-1770(-)